MHWSYCSLAPSHWYLNPLSWLAVLNLPRAVGQWYMSSPVFLFILQVMVAMVTWRNGCGGRDFYLVSTLNTLRSRQNGHHFTDNILNSFFSENVSVSIKISIKFLPRCPINNIPALVQIMAWRRTGDKPLSQPMMVSLLLHMRHSAYMS